MGRLWGPTLPVSDSSESGKVSSSCRHVDQFLASAVGFLQAGHPGPQSHMRVRDAGELMNSPKGIKWRWGRIKQQLKRHPGKRVARKGHTAVDRQVETDTGRPRLHDPTLPGVLLPEDQAGRKSLRKLQAPAWTSTQQEQLLGTGVTRPSPHPLVLHAAALGVWTGPRCGHGPQPG